MDTSITFEQLPAAVVKVLEKLNNIEQLISQFSAEMPLRGGTKPLSVNGAAAYLHLSVSAVYGMVQRGEIPYHKPAKHLYFYQEELDAWVKSERRQTKAELEVEAEQLFVNRNTRKPNAKR